MRLTIDVDKPLDLLARNSILPEIALNNGKPTIVEFYADWCEICKKMAPSMVNIKEKYDNDIDVVLLNVDNEKWLDLMEKYDVYGIPQLNLFDNNGKLKDHFVGLKSQDQLDLLVLSLINNTEISGLSSTYDLGEYDVISPAYQAPNLKGISPRSHS